jgi:Effector-associated domain 7
MMSVVLAEKRIGDFERKYGEVALQLAYHAALPVALNADLLHLLRINFFLDPPKSLPYTAEFELLLSPLCREIDEGLYEIEPEIRDILLQGLYSIDRGQRVKDVATLLWQYIDRDAVWIDRVELERAQQLTVLNFLNPAKAKEYLAEGDAEIDDGKIADRDWYVAMRQEIDRYSSPIKEEESEEIDRYFYHEMLIQHLDELKTMIVEDFIGHSYNLDYNLNRRKFSENFEDVKINEVNNVIITSISQLTAINVFEISIQVVFSVEVTKVDVEIPQPVDDGFIKRIHENGFPTIIGLISNQSVNAKARVITIRTDDKLPDLEDKVPDLDIEFVELIMQTPIVVDYGEIVWTKSDNEGGTYDEYYVDEYEDEIKSNLFTFNEELSSNIENKNDISESHPIQTINISVSTTKDVETVHSKKSNIFIYHRFESGSQTVETAKLQEKSLEILGGLDQNYYRSNTPKVKAYRGLLDEGRRGIEFTTDILPDPNTNPRLAYWSGDREGVRTQGEVAILKVLTVKNCQQQIEMTNPKKIRQLIEDLVSDDDLNNLCIDEFPRVYNQFTHGQTKSQRIRSLVEYATHQREIQKILSAIEQINPTAYHDFIINNPTQNLQENLSSQTDEISTEAQELIMTAFESSDKVIFVVETNMYTHIIAGELNFVDRPELLTTYQYAIAQLIEKGFITKMESTNCDRYELTSKGYEFCIEAAKSPQPDAKSPTDLDTMPVSKTSTVGKSAPAAKTTRSKKQPDAAKLRKIQEHISILRNSRSTDLEKISALKALGRAIDNEQAIQAILFLTRTNKNNDVITEAVKSLGNIGKKDTSVLQEMLRLLRTSSNNLVIIEVLTSLGKIGNTDSTTVRAVLNLLTFNKNVSVIINMMKALALIAKGNNEVIQKILSLLPHNNDTNVKKSMIESLGEIASGNKSAINQLISILRFSPNAPILKQFAANSLGEIAVGDKDAISAMESELKFSSSKAVKDRVSVNLNKIDPGNKAAADYRAKTKKARSTKK